MRKLRIISALILTASFNVNAMELLVDNFDGAFGSVQTNGVLAETTLGPGVAGTILGGWRDMGVAVTATNVPANVGVAAVVPAISTPGLFSFSNNAGVQSNATLQYDGANDGGLANAFSLGQDVSGFTQMKADILSADFGFNFVVTLFTSALQWSSVEMVLPSGTTTQSLDLSLFTGCIASPTCQGGGVDLANLNAIEIFFESDVPELDLTMDNIKFTVPAPDTLAMLGLGLFAFGYVSRRKVNVTLQA